MGSLYKTLPNRLTGAHIVLGHNIIVGVQNKHQIAIVGRLGMKRVADVSVMVMLHWFDFSTPLTGWVY